MMSVFYDWPFVGLVIGILLLCIFMLILPSSYFHTHKNNSVSPSSMVARFFDMRFLFYLGLPIYMLHQYEEHGYDIYGNRYAFQPFLCNVIVGQHNTHIDCPATDKVIFAINVGGVWVSASLAALYGRSRPLLGAIGALSTPAINAIVHIIPSLLTSSPDNNHNMMSIAYNPGLLTAWVLFIPYVTWSYYIIYKQHILTHTEIRISLIMGVLTHIILMGSLKLASFGFEFMSENIICIIQVINIGFMPLIVDEILYRYNIATRRSVLKNID